MFFPEARVRVYLYGQAVDMRKSFDGLYGIARAAFAGDPTAGDLYVFVSRSGDRGKFRFPSLPNAAVTAPYMHDGSVQTLTASAINGPPPHRGHQQST